MTSASPLATPGATREVLERHGFGLKKSLGQNFLVNDAVVRKILQLADVWSDDVVLEVGPGIGTLTHALLSNARAVVAVERDPSLPAVLDDTLSDFRGRFALIEKDALDVTADDVADAAASVGAPSPGKFVANLPYAVAATVVLDYFQGMASLESATVMVQREVADRMAATPGTKNYGAYTVKLAMYAKPAASFPVGPGNFMPPPHVESTVLRLDRVEGHASPQVVKAACRMADAAFFARRKTIANSCKQYFASRGEGGASDRLPAMFEAAGVDPKARGEVYPPNTYLALGRAYVEGKA